MPLRDLPAPRRLNTSHAALKHRVCNESPTLPDSFSWRLWLDSQDLAQLALESDYIQGIGNGALNPNDYGVYTVHDAAYCYYAEEDYREAEARARQEGELEIAALAQVAYESYVQYRQESFASWGLQNATALDPGDAMRAYIDVEHAIATKAPPIYLVIAMIPCNQLWAWLATSLATKVGSSNVYSFWITGNESWSGAYCLDNFVNRWDRDHPGLLDPSAALAVYRACMTCEVNGFRSATGQPLLPVPLLPDLS